MGQYYFAFLHSHVLFWLLTIIIFILAVIFNKKEGSKAGKILQMILRLLFVLVIGTGVVLVTIHNFYWATVVKGLLAIWLITMMEFLATKTRKQELGLGMLWGQFIVSLGLVLYFGYFVI